MKLHFVAMLAAILTVSPVARAAEPTISDCLSATETSLALRLSHKLREARAQLLICSAAACPVEVRDECVHRTSELNAAQPTVVFTVKTAGGQELSQVKVTMDGEVVADQLDGGALSLDPGSHSFTFEAPGYNRFTETKILHEGEKDRNETVVLHPSLPPAPGSPAVLESQPRAGESTGTSAGRRMLGLVLGGGGVAGVAVGSLFGGLTILKRNMANGECPTHPTGCSTQAIA